MQGSPPPKKKILNGKFYNTRPVGKSRTRWEDIVQKDTSQILGILGWKKRAGERRMNASSERGLGPEGAVVPQMDNKLIIMFIYCNWVVTRWQWLFYMNTKHEIGYY